MTGAKKIRVLVVDDSAFMRKAISMMIGDDPEIEVIGTANNGEEGLEKVLELSPDLVTMDIEMPRMDGLTALRKIMKEKPTPVMMVSSLTSDGAQATLDALDLGAVDFIPKQMSYVSLDIIKIKTDLIAKIKHIIKRKNLLMSRFRSRRIQEAAGKTITARRPGRSAKPAQTVDLPVRSRKTAANLRIVSIGTSTGGPPALQEVIPRLPANFPVPILVVQHMPPTFTKSLAKRLDGLARMQVKEAEAGEQIERGIVYIAPGDLHMTLSKTGVNYFIRLGKDPADSLHRPSVDVMMESVAGYFPASAMGVIMTGMGHDGINGLRKIKSSGGIVIAQNEQTCVVYGMPRAAVEAKITDRITPLDRIAGDIVSYF